MAVNPGRNKFRRPRRSALRAFPLLVCLLSGRVAAQVAAKSSACPRPLAGSVVAEPPERRSQNGVLEVTLHFKYQMTLLGEGPPRYCYITEGGLESPTLRVRPGDQLIIHFQNDPPPNTATSPGMQMPSSRAGGQATEGDCSGGPMSAFVTNLHFHGLTVPPVCHQDDVIRTLIQPGQNFEYRVQIPRDEPPGLYWYHPHPHGYSERQVQGGASGALIVEGIEELDSSLRGLRQRVLVLRDQSVSHVSVANLLTPAWDISINYVPVTYPQYQPALIRTKASERELWRVVNAAANTIFDLQVLINEVPQAVQMVAVDGVPIAAQGDLPWPQKTSILLPPGARAEFIVATPKPGDQAQLVTRQWDTGPDGDNDPRRPIASIIAQDSGNEGEITSPQHRPIKANYPELVNRDTAVIQRKLYFSQVLPNAGSPNAESADVSVFYYLTVEGQKPALYEMNTPPNIVVHQGDVEDWVVENRAREDHVFHIHQLHFRVLEIDGKAVQDPTMRDTVDLPYWSGTGPYPSVKLRLDFSDPNIVGTFLYHCHILKHEDMGMMGSIEVLPPGVATSTALSAPSRTVDSAKDVTIIATVTPQATVSAVPSGTVQFVVDGQQTGTPGAISEGHARFTASFSDSGPHTITAIYSGDPRYDESVARPLTVKIGGY